MRPIFSASRRTVVDAKSVHDDLSRHHAGPIGDRARFDMRPGMSIYMPSAKCAITTMSLGLTRPPLARPDDVNANKSLYGNKRETPSIRCPGFPGRAGTRRGRVAYPRREHDYGRSGRSVGTGRGRRRGLRNRPEVRGGSHVVNPGFTMLDGLIPNGLDGRVGGEARRTLPAAPADAPAMHIVHISPASTRNRLPV